MNPSRPFIERPIATSLIMFALFLSGLFAYQLLPIASLPEVDYPTIQVSTFYPGASPDVMTTSVTAPLERQFGQMPGLNQMISSSSLSTSIITLQFSLDTALDVAEQEVQAAINVAYNYLPSDLPIPPVYYKINPADAPILTLALTSDTMPLFNVEDFADTRLAQSIAQLSGVGLVSISGGQRPAVRVQMNTNALASYNINLEDVRAIINAQNVNAAKGNFDGPLLSYTINANDQLLTSKDYKPLIVAYRNNAPVRLDKVANVIDDVENVMLKAWMNTIPAVIINIQRQPGSNVIAVADRVKQLLTKLNAILPMSISAFVLTDRTDAIRASIHDVEFELLVAIVLVVFVIFIFLKNISATFIPSIAIPLSIIGTFGLMYLLSFSLNNLTLMALTIATGFVVDDAIVMIENITRYLEEGETPLNAALKGSEQIGFTIMSLTLSLIAVLIPLLFMTDIIGRLFREFALTLAVTILISAFISLTFTPMLCAKILKTQPRKKANTSKSFVDKLIDRYGQVLRSMLNHQPLILFLALMTFILTFILLFLIPKGFFPVQDTGVIQGISRAAQSVSFAEMKNRQKALSAIILNDPAVQNISSIIGVDGVNTSLNNGRILITLKPLNKRNASASEVIERLQAKLNEEVPGISLYMLPIEGITIDSRITPSKYQYSVSSSNGEDVTRWTKALVDSLSDNPAFNNVTSDLQNEGLQTHVWIDRDTASRLGITAQMIDNTLYNAFGQRQISTIYTQRNQYRVVLEMLPELKLKPNALNNIYINAPNNGGASALSAFTTLSTTTGPLVINRQGQFPTATISFNLNSNTSLEDAINIVEDTKNKLNIPNNIETSFEGSAKVFQNSLTNEGWLLFASILVVYIILGVLYESYIHPITILSTLPSACIGALIALILSRNELTVIAIIGIILLIGIVMKNAILMIDFALEQERQYKKSPQDAIYEACLLRFRPILMTTLAAMLGAVPLAFGWGMGSELRHPLGIAILGGLAVSQLLTLFTTPVIYLGFDRLSREFENWRRDIWSSEPKEQT